jgi:hypothetical protein
MSVIVQEIEMLAQLNALTASWAGGRSIGLFQNNWTPRHDSVISEVTPATFSGYSGLQPITGWSASAIYLESALAGAAGLVWTHNGGGVNNWIFGYYVVDGSGNLRWAELNPAGPVAMVTAGQLYAVTPQFSVGSLY